MKSSLIFILLGVLTISCTLNEASTDDYDLMREAFLNPPASAKPKVYWWCLNGNIDTVRAKQELLAMKEAGIGGFDLFEIGAHTEDVMIPGGPAFLSDESLEIIKCVVDEAGRLDLTVGLNLASSWNAGGSWVEPHHGGKSLYFSTIGLEGNSTKQSISVPFPEVSFPKEHLIRGSGKTMVPFQENGKPVYYEEVAILALPAFLESHSLDSSRIIDVSPYFDPEKDVLNWEVPEGEWKILRYICSNSGQQLVRPSPLSAGLTIDHFDSTAVETHLMYVINRLKPVLGDFENTALESFYLASYEARGFVWTSSMSDAFQKVNGYDIRKYIPALFDTELFPKEITKKVQADFKKTLSDLMINNLYKKSKEICNSYGLKINCEAGGPGYPLYNGPAEPLKALGSLDIPRGEFWINHSRIYKDNKGKEIDILRVVKEVAAASHIYEKGIVEEEAFTSFQHWQEGPFDMKPTGDRAFCEGMNRVVFHGFSHNIENSGFPGFVYHAGTHFNDKRVWWPKAKPFVQYISRLSSVFQETSFFADVLYYYGDKIPNAATAKNAHFTVGPGYDYEVINTEILINNLSFENGKLALSNGANFSMLVLESEDMIHPKVLLKLQELSGQGAIILGEKPGNIAAIKDPPISAEDGKNIIEQLWSETTDINEVAGDGSGHVFSRLKPLEVLTKLDVSPDLNYPGKDSFLLDYIHYKKGGLDFYFIRNTMDQWASLACSFRQQKKVPEIWDPVSGKILPVTVYNQKDGYVDVPLTLAPSGSQLLVFREATPATHFSQIINSKGHPPLLEFTKDGILLLEDGSFELQDRNQSRTISNAVKTQTLEGDWELGFTKGWGAPESTIFQNLSSWTESEIEGIKYFSGTATYQKTFQFEKNIDEGEKIYLDLGELSKVGEVWLNNQHVGITWAKPHRFDVSHIIKPGENELVIEVSNTWSNRLKGDALFGDNYTNTNIASTIIPNKTIFESDQTRVPWAEVPLIESGLMGPVNIHVNSLIK